jgi:hypothetical protein
MTNRHIKRLQEIKNKTVVQKVKKKSRKKGVKNEPQKATKMERPKSDLHSDDRIDSGQVNRVGRLQRREQVPEGIPRGSISADIERPIESIVLSDHEEIKIENVD